MDVVITQTAAEDHDRTALRVPEPTAFLRAGWRLCLRHPWVLVARLIGDLAVSVFRFAALFGLGLFVVIHLGNHLKFGGDLLSWFAPAVELFTRPGMVAALLGYTIAAWAITFVISTVVDAGIWGTLRSALRQERSTGLRSLVANASVEWHRAVSVRVLMMVVDTTLVAMFVGTWMTLGVFAAEVGDASGSVLFAPAAFVAFCTASVFTFSFVTRLTATFAPAPLFIADLTLARAIVRAASEVLERPILIYRLFLQASGVLIVPLFGYLFAVLFQDIAYVIPSLLPIAMVVNFTAEIALFAGISLFVLVLHATFFSFFAWTQGLLAIEEADDDEASASTGQIPSLDDLLPQEYDGVIDVDELIGPWADTAEEEEAPIRRPFDLESILEAPPSPGDGEA